MKSESTITKSNNIEIQTKNKCNDKDNIVVENHHNTYKENNRAYYNTCTQLTLGGYALL